VPSFKILSLGEISDVHSASLEVLKRVGCRIEDQESLSLLASVGAEVDVKSRTAKVPENLVEESLKKTGKTCRLYGRNPKFDVPLTHGKILGHQAEGGTYTLDLETGTHRLSTMNDLATFARLSQSLENVNVALCPVVPQDTPIQTRGIDAARIWFENTSKPCSIAGLAKGVEVYVRKMAEIVAGGPDEFRKRPIMDVASLGPTSPLQFSAEDLRVFRESVKQGGLVSVGSMPQAGGTAPITLAGTLVVQIAEVLMSITLGQLISPGLTMYAQIRAGILEPRSGAFSSGAPESGLVETAAAQVCMDKYGLYVDSGWAASDSKLMDEQVGYEKAFTWLQSGLAGVSIVSGMGAIEGGITQSAAQLVVDDEIVEMVNRIVRGIEVDTERLAVDVIEKVGIGGNFLGAKHTLKHLTDELQLTKISDRYTRKAWEKNGSKDLIEKARERAKDLLKSCEVEPLPLDVKKNLDEMVNKAKREIYAATSR
jgi:trimethylamine--corrinoid protein Co-methyltransferase